MPIKIPHGLSSPLVGLLGLTAAWTLSADPALAAGGAAPRAAVAKGAAAGSPRAPVGAAKTRFLGAHPLAKNPGTGYCYIDVPHVHDYVPDRPAVFQQVNDEYVFTGDPVPFGYEGEKTVFYGHHPVPVPPPAGVVTAAAPPMTFCFIKGPHYHDYGQPEAPGFKQKDSAVFYIGPIPPEVARERLQRERAVELEYQPYVAQRPQVVVSPPPEWQGVVWTPPPPQAVMVAAPQPKMMVAPSAPQVVVSAPVPQVVIAPPQPQVVIAAPTPQLLVAPPVMPMMVVAPPHPGVVVMPPQPHAVIIGAPGPGVVFMGHGGGGHPGWKGNHGWGHGGGGHGWKGGRHR